MKKSTVLLSIMIIVLALNGIGRAQNLGTVFTYQGKLSDGGIAANGFYDFEFDLFDHATSGNPVSSTFVKENVGVYDGYFTVEVDFGNVFNGDRRWLVIGVRQGALADPNVYTLLSPRQEMTPAPYAIHAKTAEGVVGGIGVEGSGDSNYIAKFLNTTTLGNSIIYESGVGNIGIGTTTPDAKLDIQGGSSTAVNAQSSNSNAISATSSAGGGWAAVRANATAPDTYGILGSSSNYVGGRFESDTGIALETSTSSGHAATFMGGNVGIETSNPLSLLSVGGDGSATTAVYGYGNNGVHGQSDFGTGVHG
ncbi:MAG: hypothetical protein GY869_09570, partial [Planctomycetes bacterium]|nr:hypothetical protein [Planctomycetota bacterium]